MIGFPPLNPDSLQPLELPTTSPGAAKIEYSVSLSSTGPATFAKSLSPNITSSDKTPSLTNKHA